METLVPQFMSPAWQSFLQRNYNRKRPPVKWETTLRIAIFCLRALAWRVLVLVQVSAAACGSRRGSAVNAIFRRFALRVSLIMGSPWAFTLAVFLIVVWAISGPIFDFSDTWQLVINTATTIVTFLMVFLIQNTQNRDTRAIHLKLDELIASVEQARNSMLAVEDLPDETINELKKEFGEL